MRKFTLESFGVAFGLATSKFLESGKETFEIPCKTRGLAINVRMKFHQYWKVLRAMPESQVPGGLRPHLEQIGSLCALVKPGDPLIVVLTTKDQRQLDKDIMNAVNSLEVEQAAVGTTPPPVISLELESGDPQEEALRKAGMIK